MLLPENKKINFESCSIKKTSNTNLTAFTNLSPTINKQAKNYLNLNFKFSIFDKVDEIEKNGFWFNNESVTKYLKFKAFVCFSKKEQSSVQQFISSGVDFKNGQVIEISLEDFKKGTTKNNLDETIFLANKNYILDVESIKDISFLSLVVVSYIDQSKIENDYVVNFTDTLGIRSYFFSANEPVLLIEAGQLIEQKILDLTGLEELSLDLLNYQEKLDIFLQDQELYFSDLFHSYGFINPISEKLRNKKSFNFSYGFFFDHARMLKENTSAPEFLKTNLELKKWFLDNAKILNIKLSRFRTDYKSLDGDNEETIVSDWIDVLSTDNIPFLSSDRNIIIDKMFVSRLDNLKDLLFFSGLDNSLPVLSHGKYKYKFEIEILDPSNYCLQNIKNILLQNIKTLEEYKQIAVIPDVQAQNQFNISPYLDTTNSTIKNTFISEFKKGYYIPSEDRFSDDLQDYQLKKVVDDFIYYTQFFTNLSIEELSKKGYDFNKIFKNIGSGTGNPENLQTFMNSYHVLANYIDTRIIRKEPTDASVELKNSLTSFSQTIKASIVFNNVEADPNSNNILGLRYFTPTANKGLSVLKTSQINNKNSQILEKIILNDGFNVSSIDIFYDFINLPQLLNNLIAQGATIDQAVVDNLKKSAQQIAYMYYGILDILLALYKEQEFEQLSYAFLNAPLNKKIESLSLQKEIENFTKFLIGVFNILGSSAFLQKNSTSIILEAEKIISSLLNQALSADTSESSEVNAKLFELLNIVYILREISGLALAQGILNTAKKQDFSSQSNFQKKVNYYLNNKDTVDINNYFFDGELDSKDDAKIEKSSKLKLKIETLKNIKFVSFNKNIDGNYILREPIYQDISEINPKIGNYYLGVFKDYINPSAQLFDPVYQDFPIFDRNFILQYDAEPKVIIPPQIPTVAPNKPLPEAEINPPLAELPLDPETPTVVEPVIIPDPTTFDLYKENINLPVFSPDKNPRIILPDDGFMTFYNSWIFERPIDSLKQEIVDETFNNIFKSSWLGSVLDIDSGALINSYFDYSTNAVEKVNNGIFTGLKIITVENTFLSNIKNVTTVEEANDNSNWVKVPKGGTLFNVTILPIEIFSIRTENFITYDYRILWDLVYKSRDLSISGVIKIYPIKNNLFEEIEILQTQFIDPTGLTNISNKTLNLFSQNASMRSFENDDYHRFLVAEEGNLAEDNATRLILERYNTQTMYTAFIEDSKFDFDKINTSRNSVNPAEKIFLFRRTK